MYMNCVCVRTRTSPAFKVGLTYQKIFIDTVNGCIRIVAVLRRFFVLQCYTACKFFSVIVSASVCMSISKLKLHLTVSFTVLLLDYSAGFSSFEFSSRIRLILSGWPDVLVLDAAWRSLFVSGAVIMYPGFTLTRYVT